MKISLSQFIKDNRQELDRCIARAIGRDENPYPNDKERRDCILNDEGLYLWAKSEGVKNI